MALLVINGYFGYIIFYSIHTVKASDPANKEPLQIEQTIQIHDSQIEKMIKKSFERDQLAKLNSIKVKVKQGIAILDGSVPNLISKKKATERVSLIKGLLGVVNNIQVKLKNWKTKEKLIKNVELAINFDPLLSPYQLTVQSPKKGSIIVKGKVGSWHQKNGSKILFHLLMAFTLLMIKPQSIIKNPDQILILRRKLKHY